MSFLAKVQISCFLLSYLVALACELLQVFRRQSVRTRVVLMIFTVAGFVAHTAFLLTRSQNAGLPPLLTSQQDWLLVLAWMGGLLYLILLFTHPHLAQGVFMLPAILLLVGVAVFVSRESTGNLEALALRRWGMFHAASLVLGIGAVVGATISGLMYLLHHQRLRSRSAWLKKLTLPSLENLTALNRWMVVFSVPCLTIGLMTGFMLITWSNQRGANRSIAWTDPTIVTSIVVWVAMVIVLIRLLGSSQQTGKAMAQLSLLSGGFLLITVLGPMLLAGSGNLDTFHSRAPAGRPDHQDAEPVTPEGSRSSETREADSTGSSQESPR